MGIGKHKPQHLCVYTIHNDSWCLHKFGRCSKKLRGCTTAGQKHCNLRCRKPKQLEIWHGTIVSCQLRYISPFVVLAQLSCKIICHFLRLGWSNAVIGICQNPGAQNGLCWDVHERMFGVYCAIDHTYTHRMLKAYSLFRTNTGHDSCTSKPSVSALEKQVLRIEN